MKIKNLKKYIFTFAIAIFGAFIFSNEKASALYFDNTQISYNTGDEYCDENESYCVSFYGSSTDNNYLAQIERYDLQRSYIYYGSTYYTIGGSRLTTSSYKYIRWSDSYQSDDFTGDRTFIFSETTSGEWVVTTIFNDTAYILHLVGYNLGYDEGYEAGFEGGLIEGQHRGYDEGYDDGFNVGYDLGLDDSGNSLVAMIGAIFTGPVTMLVSIFNFEFLGINLTGLILSLTTLLVVIWLVKKFI